MPAWAAIHAAPRQSSSLEISESWEKVGKQAALAKCESPAVREDLWPAGEQPPALAPLYHPAGALAPAEMRQDINKT
jgi:hypothetical protein